MTLGDNYREHSEDFSKLDLESAAPSLENDNQGPKIPTTKHALYILSMLFPSPSVDSRVRSTSWDNFVRALRGLGFEATNCVGSVVAFELQGSSIAASHGDSYMAGKKN